MISCTQFIKSPVTGGAIDSQWKLVTHSQPCLVTQYTITTATHLYVTQGAQWTPGERVQIPHWVMGLRNRRIPEIPQHMSESHNVQIFRLCQEENFDDIHSKSNCTEMSSGYVLISTRHFCAIRFSVYFIKKILLKQTKYPYVLEFQHTLCGFGNFLDFALPQPAAGFGYVHRKLPGLPVWCIHELL